VKQEQRWDLRLGLEQAFDTNVFFGRGVSVSSEPQSDFVTRLRAALSRSRTGARGSLSLAAGASAFAYARLSEFNGVAATGTVRGSYAATPRLELSLAESFETGYARDLRALSDEGLLLPRVRSNRNDASLGLRLATSSRGSLLGLVRHEWLSFDSAEFSDDTELGARLGASRALTANHSLSLTYGYQLGRAGRPALPVRETTTHSLSASWSGDLDARWSAHASGGAALIRADPDPQTHLTPTVQVGLRGRLQHGRIEAGYHREVRVAFGFGRSRVLNIFRLAHEQRISARLRLASALGYSFGRDPADLGFDIRTVTLSTGATQLLARRWELGAGYSYGRRRYSAQDTLDNHVLEASLRFHHAW
jgi:hypothetical protein